MSQFLATLGRSTLQQHSSSTQRLQLRAALCNRAAIDTYKAVKEWPILFYYGKSRHKDGSSSKPMSGIESTSLMILCPISYSKCIPCSKMKSGAKHSEVSVSEVFCLYLQAAESWSYVFPFCPEKLSVLHKNTQTAWWLHDLRSQYRFSTPGDGVWPQGYFDLHS